MTVFFYICDYPGVTPKEFFDDDISLPTKVNELTTAAKKLDREQPEHLIAIVKAMSK